VSTDLLDQAWQVHPQASVRAEQFGALLYHFGTRRLSFVKDPRLLTVLRSLSDHHTARAACVAAGMQDDELASFRGALAALHKSQMIVERAGL